MKKIIALLAVVVSAYASQAQKVINDQNAEARNVGSFNGVAVSSGIDLYLSAGDEAVAVSADKPEQREKIKTEVKNGVLRIYIESKSGINIRFNSGEGPRAYVSYKTLKSLAASGGSDVVVEGELKADKLELGISGGSDFTGKVDVQTLEVAQSGGADVSISGKATNLKVAASGGSDFSGFDLVTEVCELAASGGSDIQVTATKEISAAASGASDITYKGSPKVKGAAASGASSVKAKG